MNTNDQNNLFPNGNDLNNTPPQEQDIPWYRAQASQPSPAQEPEQAAQEDTYVEYDPEPQPEVTAEAEPAPEYQSREQSAQYYQSSDQQQSRQEPVFSPYSSQYSYNYSTAQSHTEPEKKQKKSSAGKKILALLLAVIVIICGVIGAYSVKNKSQKSVSDNSSSQGGATLKIEDSKSVASVDSSDGLSSEEIYAMNQKSNVGIILYTSNQSFFSSGNSSKSSNVAGEGSGIVMGPADDKSVIYIITCAHVISNAQSKNYRIVVQDYEGNQYDATYVGADSKTDIGVISVKYTDKLPAAKFGDSSKLVIGETVYAIGNPGGTEFFGSFTKGMVSSIERPVSNEIGYEMKSIQHDAAINPGNSGGMLLNSSGQVIGINSSKIASTEYEGMGFAIPITSAQPIINDLIANGHVTNRPKLGITYSPISAYPMYAMVAHYNNLPAGSLIIREIPSKSALTGTKIQAGDLITAVNGEKLETADVLLDKIENGKVGDKLTLTIVRLNESNYEIESTFDVTVALIEDDGQTETTTQATQSIEDFFSPFFGN